MQHNTWKIGQKLDTKSTTESEDMDTINYILWTIWAKRFLQHQGYELKSNIFYQDNKSATAIEKKNRKSCGEKSRYIHIIYLFIKDLLLKKKIGLRHCPKNRMIADFYTKPLQKLLFRNTRYIIMGLAPFTFDISSIFSFTS